MRGFHHREGIRWFEELFALDGEAPDAVRASALGVAARMTVELGDSRRAKPWYRHSLELARAAGDDVRAAWALHGLGDVPSSRAGWRRRGAASKRASSCSWPWARTLPPAVGSPTSPPSLSVRATSTRPGPYLEQARSRYGTAGDAAGVTAALHGLADLALEEGDHARALGQDGEALEKGRRAATPWDLAYYLAGIAAACAGLGRRLEAARLWGAMERLDADLDVKIDRAVYEPVLGRLDPREVAAGADLGTQEALAVARSSAARAVSDASDS